MPPQIFPRQVPNTRRHGGNRFIVKEPFDVLYQFPRTTVTSITIFFDRFQHHLVKISLQDLLQIVLVDLSQLSDGCTFLACQSAKASRRLGSFRLANLST